MPENIAERVLRLAAVTLKERGVQHGDTRRSFMMAADLWSTYVGHAFSSRNEFKLYPSDVTNMLAIMKLVRSVYGNSEDNYIDGSGYIALSAMLEDMKPGKGVSEWNDSQSESEWRKSPDEEGSKEPSSPASPDQMDRQSMS